MNKEQKARDAERRLRGWQVHCVDCDLYFTVYQRWREDPETGDILMPCPKCGTVGSLILALNESAS